MTPRDRARPPRPPVRGRRRRGCGQYRRSLPGLRSAWRFMRGASEFARFKPCGHSSLPHAGRTEFHFQVLDLDDEARQLRIARGVEAGVVARHAGEADGLSFASRMAVRSGGHLGRIARYPGLLHRLLQEVDDVIGLRSRCGAGVFFVSKPRLAFLSSANFLVKERAQSRCDRTSSPPRSAARRHRGRRVRGRWDRRRSASR